MPLPDSARPERADWLRLVLTPGVGPAGSRALLAAFRSPRAALEATPDVLGAVVGPAVARALQAQDPARDAAVAQALDWASAPRHHLLALADPAYPDALRQISDPPALLFVTGDPARRGCPPRPARGRRAGPGRP